MAGAIQSGYSFAGGEEVTSTKLHQIIEGPNSPSDTTLTIVTGFDQTNMASGAGLCIAGTAAPSDTDAIWYDTTLGLLRIYDGTNWQPVGQGVVLNNASGASVAAGDVVIVSTGTDSSFTTTTSANSALYLGVAAETIASSASGVIRTHGRTTVNLVSAGTRGQWVGTSTTVKLGLPSSTATTNQFGILTTAGTTGVGIVLYGHCAL